ncbi:MAG: protein translocase subunit SecD [Gemmatimonadetes bacterium]|nr:protein translocase subunit SecD [Gemmatimonadota bacterium]
MFATIRNRMILIAVLVIGSIIALIPRTVTVRERSATGAMQDVQVKRVPLKRGLDLQGGMHLGLELDQSTQVSADVSKDIDLALTVLRKRIDEFGVTEPVIQKVGSSRIVVELAGIKDPERAKGIVQQNAFLEFRMTDKTGALDAALPAMDRVLAQLGVKPAAGAPTAAKGIDALLAGDSGKKLPADSGVKADSGAAAAADTVKAGGPILQALIISGASAGATAPGTYLVPEASVARVDSLLRLPEVQRVLPRGIELKWDQSATGGLEPMRALYALETKPILTGTSLVNATPQIDPSSNKPIVVFDLDRAGGRRFGQETSRHIGDFMAIVLDGKVQGAPPVINSRIDRRGQIELSGRTIAEAQDLALTLKAGALPFTLKIVEERTVGASLGEDSVRGGIVAGLVGTLFVILIMVGYYRMSGALAVLALALYILFTLASLSMIDATLTLPGLAGIVLSVGIAVDANVLIFERIREELIAGRTVRVAVEEGFRHAMPAIIDSNVSTVLTAAFLFQFGTGPVKGFAVTLIMGIIASMITAIFVTKTFFLVWLDRKPHATTLSI